MLRLLLLSLSVGQQPVSVSATAMAASDPSVSAVFSVTAMTGLQLRRYFRLRPKPEKSGFGRSLLSIKHKMAVWQKFALCALLFSSLKVWTDLYHCSLVCPVPIADLNFDSIVNTQFEI